MKMLEKTILLAEDEPSISRLVKTYFEHDGYIVYTATNGEEAINIFKEIKINLVCLDVMMPKMDGFEVTKIIRSSSDVPIIIMTALQNERLKNTLQKVLPKIMILQNRNLI